MKRITIKGKKFLLLSWKEIINLVRKLSYNISEKYEPNLIIGLLRGGIIVSRLLSDELRVKDMLSLGVKNYVNIGLKDRIEAYQWVNEELLKGKRVLLVDDVCDSGETMRYCFDKISKIPLESIRSATLHIKPWSKFKPDFYAQQVEEWIVYPWEKREFLEWKSKKGEQE